MQYNKPSYMEAVNDYLVVKKEFIEEERSNGGIITNVSSVFDFGDTFSKKNVVKAEVVYDNEDIPFGKAGERIVFNGHKGSTAMIDWDELTVIKKDQVIAKIDNEGKYIVHPDCIMVKISKYDRDSLYFKTIVRHDGKTIQLFIQPDYHKDTTQRSKVYVSVGEVVQVGANVIGINEKDLAILDYTVDNDIDSVLYYDENKDKFIVINATTVLHEYDEWAYATRQSSRDVKVSAKGDIQIMSPILGVIRGEKLIARFPYCFLEHKPTKVEKKSQLGIIYTEQEYILERKVLAISDASKKRYDIKENQFVLIQDPDMFDVVLRDGKVQCIMDCDIMLGKL